MFTYNSIVSPENSIIQIIVHIGWIPQKSMGIVFFHLSLQPISFHFIRCASKAFSFYDITLFCITFSKEEKTFTITPPLYASS